MAGGNLLPPSEIRHSFSLNVWLTSWSAFGKGMARTCAGLTLIEVFATIATMNKPRILKAEISPMPQSMFDPMPTVTAHFDNGEAKTLFSYYPDEISFQPSEFVGLTEDEARSLFHRKDVAYLQSN